MGGLLIPLLLGVSVYMASLQTSFHVDAFGAAFVIGVLVYIIVIALQPVREYFDSDHPSFAANSALI